jgi:hypothetical protein
MTSFEITIAIITIIAIIVGPIAAVAVTLWHESRKEKRQTQLWLFLTLVAYRQSSPPALEWVNALNQIDVVFYNVPEVIKAWREYYDALNRTAEQYNAQTANHRHLDLLQAMAEHLGYPKIKQTDLDRFYTPIQYGNVASVHSAIQWELLRVLSNTQHLVVAPIPTDQQQAEQTPQQPPHLGTQPPIRGQIG